MAFESLQRARFAALMTKRANGDAVNTPVWVVVVDGKGYVVSRGPGKVKRIRANPSVEIGPSSSRGGLKAGLEPAIATIVGAEFPHEVRRAFRRKYGPLPALGRALAGLSRRELVLIDLNGVTSAVAEEAP